MGWTVGPARVGSTGIFPVCPFVPIVKWDGMDSKNRVGYTGVFPECPAIPMVQWDGIDRIGIFPVCQYPSVPVVLMCPRYRMGGYF